MIGRNSFNRISSLIRKWEGALWLAGAVGVVLIGGILSWWLWDKLGGDTESFSPESAAARSNGGKGRATAARAAKHGPPALAGIGVDLADARAALGSGGPPNDGE